MAATINIPKGNDFDLLFPLSILTESGNQPLSVEELTDIHVTIGNSSNLVEYPYTSKDSILCVSFEENLDRATYDVHITAKYNGRDIASHLKACFRIVDWNKDANIENHFPKGEYTAETSVFIGNFNTDDELESLKDEYRKRLEEAEQAKANADEQTSKAGQALIDSVNTLKSQHETIDAQQATLDTLNETINSQQATIASQQSAIVDIIDSNKEFAVGITTQILKIIG